MGRTEPGSFRRRAAIATALLVGGGAIAAPIVLGLSIARKQGETAELERLHLINEELLHRWDETREQVHAASVAVRGSREHPCSKHDITHMQQIDIASIYLQAIGRVSDGRLICSSLGYHAESIALGPAQLRRRSPLKSWIGIRLPLVPNQTVNVYEDSGIAAIVHPDIAADMVDPDDTASVGLVALNPLQVIRSHGTIRPEWLSRADTDGSFVDHDFLVSIRRDSLGFAAAIAAAPMRVVRARSRDLAMLLVPIGLLAGLLVALVVMLLTRQFLSLRTALRSALRRNELSLDYQPMVDLRSGVCAGAEVLLRWRRSDGRAIRPEVFIAVAEETGLIGELTQRVCTLLAREGRDLLARHPWFRFSINLSSADLQSDATLRLLQGLVRALGGQPTNIVLEATERGLLEAEAASPVLASLREAGFSIAVDDFGTGYSSLSYLQRFRFDFLKIDKSFIDALDRDAPTSQVAAHIIEMAKSLDLQVIAEGVESESQEAFLRHHEVEFAQGWLYGRPLAMDALLKVVDGRPATAA